MIWTDGSKYVGEWKNGIQNGLGKMEFPNGTVKEGFFENNIFKGKKKPEEPVFVDKEVRLSSNMDPVEQESLWEKYGQNRKSVKNVTGGFRSGEGWDAENKGLPDINLSHSGYNMNEYGYNAMNATDPISMGKRKNAPGSFTANSFNRGRPKHTADNVRKAKYNSAKRGRVVTATSTKVKRHNISATSITKRKRKNY